MKTKIISALIWLGVVVTIAGCKHTNCNIGNSKGNKPRIAGVPTDNELTFSRNQATDNPQPAAHRDRTKIVPWHMKDRAGKGFDLHVISTPKLSWSYGVDGATNFAILVPGTNYWKPLGTCYWTNCPCLGPWPAVFPDADGFVFLQFLPGQGSRPGDYFHYKIAIIGTGANKGGIPSRMEEFSNDSDGDIIDTTIVWDGAIDNLKSGAHK